MKGFFSLVLEDGYQRNYNQAERNLKPGTAFCQILRIPYKKYIPRDTLGKMQFSKNVF